MQALLDLIIRNLLQLWPIARVYSWQAAFRVRRGVAGAEMGAGLHWRWPFLDEIYRWPKNEQCLDAQAAGITTTDRVPVTIAGNFAYHVRSIRQMWLSVFHVDSQLCKLLQSEIARAAARRTYGELVTGRGAVEAEVIEAVNARVRGWGIELTRVQLTDLTTARPHRHYLDAAAGKTLAGT
jgi:regulator of protease activity HflC (stomatin/prohibitin superfamily)